MNKKTIFRTTAGLLFSCVLVAVYSCLINGYESAAAIEATASRTIHVYDIDAFRPTLRLITYGLTIVFLSSGFAILPSPFFSTKSKKKWLATALVLLGVIAVPMEELCSYVSMHSR
ncbi:MAG: hypothetical protein K2X81_09520 [Candidatus Obscuribacterales bacterium]|nr:hypothetical protein [Candidatus Obscuribacterales bacterium]